MVIIKKTMENGSISAHKLNSYELFFLLSLYLSTQIYKKNENEQEIEENKGGLIIFSMTVHYEFQ